MTGTDPAVQRRTRLRAGVWTETAAGGDLWLVGRRRGVSLGAAGPARRAVLARLAEPTGLTGDELTDIALAADGMTGLLAVEGMMAVLRAGDWLATSVVLDDRVLLTASPGRAGASPAGRLVLSRFAVLRRENDTMLLESPLTAGTVDIVDPRVLAVLDGGDGGLPQAAVTEVIALLAATGFLVPAEPDDLTSAQWSPHELWFHARSRLGAHEQPYGGTYWAKDRFDPLPARHPRYRDNPAVDLDRPDLDSLRGTDMRLTEVLETRRSVRAHDPENALTLRQLGEFLFRTARTRGVAHDGMEELCDRPYPSGGALHELELYPVVTRVAGLDPGVYHYDGHGHRLETLAGVDPSTVDRLVRTATRMAVMDGPPQVLVVVAARFGRVMWKYQTMAYALVLKHVGVLYQTMYCVATAMGLAACALGGGDVAEFAAATGLDPLAESSVGEFLLGSAPAGIAAASSANPAGHGERG